MKKSKSFFHTLKATLDRLADRLLMYALGHGNFLDALSKNDVGVALQKNKKQIENRTEK